MVKRKFYHNLCNCERQNDYLEITDRIFNRMKRFFHTFRTHMIAISFILHRPISLSSHKNMSLKYFLREIERKHQGVGTKKIQRHKCIIYFQIFQDSNLIFYFFLKYLIFQLFQYIKMSSFIKFFEVLYFKSKGAFQK